MSRTVRVLVVVWACALAAAIALSDRPVQTQGSITDAPTGFDGGSNGFLAEFCSNQANLVDSPNSPMIPDDECNQDAAIEEFTGPETPGDGLGPIFNAAGCGECHLVPILGGGSQIMEKRAGFFDGDDFIDHPGGSLIQDRSLVLGLQELATPANTNVTTFRATLAILGDGFVEAISNTTLQNIANAQPSSQRGQIINVPVLERPGRTRIGRFGWKNQQASLVSFSADAYKNEMGITSPLEPVENTSNGVNVEEFDLPGVDDEGVDVELFALFMRDTKAPPVNAALAGTQDAQIGSQIFNNIGCNVCHTRQITTSPPGTLINGGALRVANALGNKIIRPFSDFLLHDIGTGDGIVQNGGQSTRNKVRTAPLWGLHTRGRFMHDASSFSLTDAIDRHRNQASAARSAFFNLGNTSRNRLITFLLSL
jgi:CxxC motif-containing protein (DUF1111 family)